jgi:hypothetical protein
MALFFHYLLIKPNELKILTDPQNPFHVVAAIGQYWAYVLYFYCESTHG